MAWQGILVWGMEVFLVRCSLHLRIEVNRGVPDGQFTDSSSVGSLSDKVSLYANTQPGEVFGSVLRVNVHLPCWQSCILILWKVPDFFFLFIYPFQCLEKGGWMIAASACSSALCLWPLYAVTNAKSHIFSYKRGNLYSPSGWETMEKQTRLLSCDIYMYSRPHIDTGSHPFLWSHTE